MVYSRALENFANKTVIDLPWNETIAWLAEGDHYIHVAVEHIGPRKDMGIVSVSEIVHHYAWFYSIFWLLVGVLITVIMHVPVYSYLTSIKQKTKSPKEDLAHTCPPKYENSHLESGAFHNLELAEVDPVIKTPSSDNEGQSNPPKADGRPDLPSVPTDNK